MLHVEVRMVCELSLLSADVDVPVLVVGCHGSVYLRLKGK